MPPRKEICRNFQRGSCQYGDLCKFLHAAPQQEMTSPFGFGMQASNQLLRTTQHQRAPNPFGFGVQSNAQQRGGNNFGSQPNQFKPFENKWTRSSLINSNDASLSRKQESQPQAASHKCTDPEACRCVMIGDVQNEKPLWKLTCYGHKRCGPCDITGDISCEELCASAYGDAKSGKSLQFIIERERDLLNSKEVQVQNLVHRPSLSSNTTISSQSPFDGNQSDAPFKNSNIPPTVSSFGQLSASLNTKAVATPSYNFGQPNAIQNNAQPHLTFSVASANSTAHQNPFFNTANSRNSTTTPDQNPFAISANVSNSARQNPFSSTLASSSQFGNANGNQMDFPSASLVPDSTATTGSKNPSVADDSSWSKPDWKWNSDEIPEESPPDNYIC